MLPGTEYHISDMVLIEENKMELFLWSCYNIPTNVLLVGLYFLLTQQLFSRYLAYAGQCARCGDIEVDKT